MEMKKTKAQHDKIIIFHFPWYANQGF